MTVDDLPSWCVTIDELIAKVATRTGMTADEILGLLTDKSMKAKEARKEK